MTGRFASLRPIQALGRIWQIIKVGLPSCFAIAIALWLMSVAAPSCLALTVSEIPNPRAAEAWVSDTAEQISAPVERRLNGLLNFLEQETSIEMAVVTISAVSPPETLPKAFATELFNTWGIGKAEVNNGVLFLLSVGDRRIEIETGRGLETQLPNDRLTAIIQEIIRPALQQNDIDAGVWEGTAAIVAELTGIDANAPFVPEPVRSLYPILLAVSLMVAMSGLIWLVWLSQQPTPLPATGTHTYTTQYGRPPLNAVSFNRLVITTPYFPTIPLFPSIVTAVGLTLSAGAIAFWVLASWYVSFDPRSTTLLLLTVIISSLLSLVLPLSLDKLFRRKVTVSDASGRVRDEPLRGRKLLGDWLLRLLMFGWIFGVIAGLVVLGFLLFQVIWTGLTHNTDPSQLAVIAPLYVGLCNAGIAAYFIHQNRGMPRTPSSYCCQTCRTPIVSLEANAPELIELLSPPSNLIYRAWRCPTCHPTLSADGLFLITQALKPKSAPASKTHAAPSTFSSRSSSSTDSSYDSSYDLISDTTSLGDSGSSDFGGGSSDGGGAGDNW